MMANKDVYVPYYVEGSDGKVAYEFIKLSGSTFKGGGTVVPEGEVMINSRSVTQTPPARLQPKGNQKKKE